MSEPATATASTEDVTERVLAGAEKCFERFGVGKTSVEDVARAAGVSRKTVYRYFTGGRDEIVLSVLLRRGAPHYERIQRLMRAQPDVSEALVLGVVETVRSIRTDEYLALLIAPDEASRTAAIAGRSEAIFAGTRASLEPLFARARDQRRLLAGVDLDDATEWVMRVIASFATVDVRRRRGDDELAELLRRLLAPAFFEDG